MQVGDIEYRVYLEDGLPWVSRCKVIKISPKGYSITYKAIDVLGLPVFKSGQTEGTSKTKVEALKKCQQYAIESHYWPGMEESDSIELRVKVIVKAQELIDELMFCPSI